MHSEITATANIASFSSVVREWGKQTGHHLLRPVQILKRYRRVDRRPDLVAGLTVAVVMLPQAIAYALIAELPPQVGLYAAIVTAIVGALWGSSAHLHSGPTNAASLPPLAPLPLTDFEMVSQIAAGTLAWEAAGYPLALE